MHRRSLGGGAAPTSSRKSLGGSRASLAPASSANTNNKHYVFPTLRIAEIAATLNIMDCNCTEEEISKPTPDSFQRICFQIIERLDAINREDFERPIWTEDIIEHADILSEAATFSFFHAKLRYILEQIGVDDFEASDLVKPETPRVKLILSALINFAKYREDKVTVFEDCEAASDELKLQREQIERQHKAYKKQLADLQAKEEAEAPVIADLKAKITADKEAFDMYLSQHKHLNEKMEDAKETKERLQQQLKQKDALCDQLTTEKKKLARLIVSNPQELKQTNLLLSEQIEALRRQVAEEETKSRDLTKKQTVLHHDLKLVEEANRQMQDVLQVQRKDRELWQHVEAQEKEIERGEVHLHDIKHELEVLHRQIDGAKDRYNTMERQHTIKMTQQREYKASLQQSVEDALSEQRTAEQTIHEHDQHIHRLKEEVAEAKRRMDADVAQTQQKRKEALDYFYSQYLHGIRDALNEAMEVQ